MSKSDQIFICSNCDAQFSKWFGQCPKCKKWNTLEQESVVSYENTLYTATDVKVSKISEIEEEEINRASSGFVEFDRVLGGKRKNLGFVPASVVLLAGDPGIGKSTLLLQTLYNVATEDNKPLYISAEESAGQIAMRAKRIFKNKSKLSYMNILPTSDISQIIKLLGKLKPKFVVVDSIQTVVDKDIRGVAGGIAQVKSVTLQLIDYAKKHGITVVIVGHINKEGNVAGPKVLEHLVDAVLQMEGDDKSGYRLLRSLKNRFGPTNEIGILSIAENGLIDIKNASSYFVTDQQAEGVARSAILEGNRVIIVEVQALTVKSVFVQPKRVAQGITNSKLQLICAILQKHTNLKLYDKDVYLNIAGGLRSNDPGLDLAVAYSIASSILMKKVSTDTAVIGELSLTGAIGNVVRSDLRKKELHRMGYSRIVDSNSYKDIRNLILALSKRK